MNPFRLLGGKTDRPASSHSDSHPRWNRSVGPVALILERLEERCLLSYSITDLGTLGGAASFAYALSDLGRVVGEADVKTHFPSDRRAFLYVRGRMLNLGTLGGAYSYGYGLNDAIQVVGSSQTTDSGTGYLNHPFLWQGGTMTYLGSLGGQYGSGSANAINNIGQVVGASQIPNPNYTEHAFRWQNGTMIDLGTLGGESSYAYDINDSGQVVGASQATGTPYTHAFLWQNGVMTDLGTLGGIESTARAINNAGQVAGSYMTVGFVNHAFGPTGDLGTLGGKYSYAYGINDAGQIVGYSTYTGGTDFDYHAFVYQNGAMTDVNELLPPGSGWTLYRAQAINNAGQIVGYGRNSDGQFHAYLLTPDQGRGLHGVATPLAWAGVELAAQTESSLGGHRSNAVPTPRRLESHEGQARPAASSSTFFAAVKPRHVMDTTWDVLSGELRRDKPFHAEIGWHG